MTRTGSRIGAVMTVENFVFGCREIEIGCGIRASEIEYCSVHSSFVL